MKGNAIDFDHTFCVENRSKKTVKLREVQSDCGCLVAKGLATMIEPGGQAQIKVTISVFGPPGPFQKTITVREDSESNGTIPLSVIGRRAISDLLYCAPPKIVFGLMGRGESKTKQLVLSRYDGSPVNFRDLNAKDGTIHLDGEPVRGMREDKAIRKICECVELPIRLDLESQPPGPFKSRFTIRTDSADASTAELQVDVEATIVEPESPWVPSIFVTRLERGASVDRPMTNRREYMDCPEMIPTYEGDDSLQVEFIPASHDGAASSPPRVRISRSHDSTGGGLARGTLSLRKASATGELLTRIDIAAFLPR